MSKKLILDLIAGIIVVAILLLIKIPYINLIIAVILVLIYCHKTGGIKRLGFIKPVSWPKTLFAALLTSLGIILLSVFVLLPVIQNITNQQLDLGPFAQLQGNTALWLNSMVLGWIIGGFVEEIIFRAFFISRLTDHLPEKIAHFIGLVFPSILFGYLHSYQGPSGQVLTGCVGLALAVCYIMNGRKIWLNIMIHGLINTVVMTLLYLDILKLS